MFKFVFYLGVSALVFSECSGFWFDLFADDTDEYTVDSSSEGFYGELVEWIARCLFVFNFETERPDPEPPIKNLTNPMPIKPNSNPNLGQKNSSGTQENIPTSDASPSIISGMSNPQVLAPTEIKSSETKKDINTGVQNEAAPSQNATTKEKIIPDKNTNASTTGMNQANSIK